MPQNNFPFSVILPVYKGDVPDHLDQALQSLANQSLQADEILVIKDGPLTKALENVLSQWQRKMPALKTVSHSENKGLSEALNTGIKNASHDWLARMDADDICERNRFEVQVNYLKAHPEISILGSWIYEFEEDPGQVKNLRKLPERHDEIAQYARYRCPFNHMTVMYKKQAVINCGMYRDYGAVGDDYVLWVDFILNGYKTANIPMPLVRARTGKDFYNRRRRGMKYLKNEIREIQYFYKKGFISTPLFLLHFTVKSVVRLSPPWLVKIWYRLLRKS